MKFSEGKKRDILFCKAVEGIIFSALPKLDDNTYFLFCIRTTIRNVNAFSSDHANFKHCKVKFSAPFLFPSLFPSLRSMFKLKINSTLPCFFFGYISQSYRNSLDVKERF